MKEKKFLRSLILASVLLLAAYLAANVILKAVLDDSLIISFSGLTEGPDRYAVTADGSELVSIRSVESGEDGLTVTVEPTGEGSGDASLEVLDMQTLEPLEGTLLHVAADGTVTDMSTGNFSHYRERQLCITLLCISVAVLLWATYFRSCRLLMYSYHSIFSVGLGIWVTLVSVLMLISYLRNEQMLVLYTRLADAPMYFALYSFPLVLLFAVLLSVSNISLIRHEGFRGRNALGILLSAIMVLGFALLQWLFGLDASGSEQAVDLRDSVIGILFCVYAILECFLQGAVICGTRAARHQPAFDKDYIVILGCMIRKDGTLYPLIRGRVDRAIRFYREQLAATGKQAIFVPSGGQGRNECMAEAEAMRRYLLEQGFDESQILPEDQSVNTRQNMEFSRRLTGPDAKVAFSTTNYHVFRSGIISRQVGFEAEGMGSPTKWYFWPNAYVREVIGMLSYKWKSLVLVLIPVAAFLTAMRFVF